MTSLFLKYLEKLDSPLDIVDEELERFTEKLLEYHEYVKERNRDEDLQILEVGRKLRDLGAPMESHKLLKADADYFLNKNKKKEYWRQMYYAGAFANLGYPTTSIEEEARLLCRQLREDNEFHPFLCLFLNNYAGILHIYREENPVANELYREAVTIIENINPKIFEQLVGKRRYMWAHKLIINNYIDSLFATDRTEFDEEELKKMMGLASKNLNKTESEYVRILTRINRAELLARKGKGEESEKLLDNIKEKASDSVRRFIEPSFYRVSAIILAKRGQVEESVNMMVHALEESGYYGNTLEETLTMRDSLYVYGILTEQGKDKDLFDFFQKKGLFSYLLNVIKIKDWFLGAEHSERVRDTAIGLGYLMNLDDRKIQLINASAVLHDVGKFVIPWYSLNKISSLDELDWEILRAHPEEGGRILAKLKLYDISEIVTNHHERIDGSGYPRGIKNLSIETEIVAISDEFNAATTPNRKYRFPKDYDTVLKEIKKDEKGKFSPDVVKAIEKYVEKCKA